MRFRSVYPLVLSVLLAPGLANDGFCQGKVKEPLVAEQTPNTRVTAAAEPAPAADQQIPDGPALSILIRRTLLTLNDANLTGNYTVLRDLTAPGFQAANNPAKLAEIFVNLRRRGVDLAPVMYFDPKLVREPMIEANGMLRLSGFIPSRPEQVNFDMMFQKVDGRWRLFGIAVNTAPAADPALPTPEAPAAPAGATGKK